MVNLRATFRPSTVTTTNKMEAKTTALVEEACFGFHDKLQGSPLQINKDAERKIPQMSFLLKLCVWRFRAHLRESNIVADRTIPSKETWFSNFSSGLQSTSMLGEGKKSSEKSQTTYLRT